MKQTIAVGVIVYIPGRLPPPNQFQNNYGAITRMTGITGFSFGLMSRPATTGFGAITSVSQYGGDTRPNTKGIMISEPLPYCTEEVEDDDGSATLTSGDAVQCTHILEALLEQNPENLSLNFRKNTSLILIIEIMIKQR